MKEGTWPENDNLAVERLSNEALGIDLGDKVIFELDKTDSAQRVPRVTGVSSGQPILEDGRVLDVANVVWATGFLRDYRWISLPVFDANGEPIDHRGVVPGELGLYFTGLPFQSSLLSGLVAGATPDAKHIVKQLATRARAADQAYERRLMRRETL